MIEAVIAWALLSFMLIVCCAVIAAIISEAKLGEGDTRGRKEMGTAVVFEEDGVYVVTVHENSLTVRKNEEE